MIEEQIIRNVKIFGNGAHVFVPKEWVGEQVVLVRPKRSLKGRILEVLEPYLESIIGVYLYGSYARKEQTQDSDIDLLIITNEKVKIRERGFEIISLEQKEIEKAIKLEPLLMYSIFLEAKPIINSKLIGEFKERYKPKLTDFKDFLKDCERIININKDFLELETGKYTLNEAVIYSLILRLRGLFILKFLIDRKIYSNKDFKKWIIKNLPEIDFNSIYKAYRFSKIDKKFIQKIKVSDVKLLLEFFRKELHILQDGKKRKKA
ncbi:MAG: DUF2080 family transposase-associated protein [Nanoarchaeota archaeon]